MKAFYYVYRPHFGYPTRKHEDFFSAQDEAERLSKKHPGVSFEILKCVAITSAPEPTPSTFFVDFE